MDSIELEEQPAAPGDRSALTRLFNDTRKRLVETGTRTGTITATGDITAYSDASLKTEVATISNALDLVNRLRGVTFTRTDSGDRGIGVIAQELAAVVPEAVLVNEDGLLSVAYGNLVGVLIEAVKELANKVERLGGGSEILDLT